MSQIEAPQRSDSQGDCRGRAETRLTFSADIENAAAKTGRDSQGIEGEDGSARGDCAKASPGEKSSIHKFAGRDERIAPGGNDHESQGGKRAEEQRGRPDETLRAARIEGSHAGQSHAAASVMRPTMARPTSMRLTPRSPTAWSVPR